MPVAIVLDGITLTTPGRPNPIPVPTRPARIKTYFMRTGAGGSGLRCIRRLGSHASYQDFRFRLGYLTPAQVAQLQLKHDNQTTMVLSIGGTSYTVIFQEGGFQPVLARWVEPDEFYAATVAFHVLSQG